jgi:hypothetical protein
MSGDGARGPVVYYETGHVYVEHVPVLGTRVAVAKPAQASVITAIRTVFP